MQELAHLGNDASVAAARDGQSIDTSMGFTPTGGLPMSTRSGDLDPGMVWYLIQSENLTPKQFNKLRDCVADFHGRQPDHYSHHSHGRRTDGCALGVPRTRTWHGQ